MVLLKEIVHLIIQHGPLRLGNVLCPCVSYLKLCSRGLSPFWEPCRLLQVQSSLRTL